MNINSGRKRTYIKFTTVKEYLFMYNSGYQVIRFLEIHLNIGYSSFIFKCLYLYVKNHTLQLFNLVTST